MKPLEPTGVPAQWDCYIGHGDALATLRDTGRLPVHVVADPLSNVEKRHLMLSRIIAAGLLDSALDDWSPMALKAIERRLLLRVRNRLAVWQEEERAAAEAVAAAEAAHLEDGFARFRALYAETETLG